MSHVATVAPATVAPTPLIQWATKSGKSRERHSDLGAALAPRSVRLGAAQQATLEQMRGGIYRPILRDFVASLSPAHLAGIRAHVAQTLSTWIDGVQMTPSGDPLVPNKRVLRAVAQWANAPTIDRKGVISDKPLSKGSAPYVAVLLEWVRSEEERTAEE